MAGAKAGLRPDGEGLRDGAANSRVRVGHAHAKFAYVPLHFLFSLFRGTPAPGDSPELYVPEVDRQYGDLSFRRTDAEILRDYRMGLDARQLDLMLALYANVDPETGTARFGSLYEWGCLAAGEKGPDVSNYTRELTEPGKSRKRNPEKPALNESRRIWIDYYDKGRKRVPCVFVAPPVNLTLIKNAATGTTRFAQAELAFFLRHRLNGEGKLQHYRRVPLACRKLLKEGGIKRVETAHMLFFLYLFTRPGGRAITMSLETICARIGIAHYLAAYQKKRAEKVIQDSLAALIRQRVISDESGYQDGELTIYKNRFYFSNSEKEE